MERRLSNLRVMSGCQPRGRPGGEEASTIMWISLRSVWGAWSGDDPSFLWRRRRGACGAGVSCSRLRIAPMCFRWSRPQPGPGKTDSSQGKIGDCTSAVVAPEFASFARNWSKSHRKRPISPDICRFRSTICRRLKSPQDGPTQSDQNHPRNNQPRSPRLANSKRPESPRNNRHRSINHVV